MTNRRGEPLARQRTNRAPPYLADIALIFLATAMRFIAVLLAAFTLTGCLASPPAGEVQALADSVEAVHAPDRRTARFDVDAGLRSGGALVLRGSTTNGQALADLRSALDARGIAYEDSVAVWPGEGVGAERWAVAANAVAHLRGDPRYSAELVTQVVLGTPLNILEDTGRWFIRVQTPEGYIGWVDSGTIERMDAEALLAYQRTPKLIVTEATAWALDAPRTDAARVGDLVAGSLLELGGTAGGFYAVRYPDGREAFVDRDDARPWDDWLADQPDPADAVAMQTGLVDAAQQMRGVPYLWGGTSTKGVDCSGFTKTVYLLNGFLIPRDASQQVRAGVPVETPRDGETIDFTALEPGDLLFFGRPATEERSERVVHVGMWIGDDQFIHSSGRVLVSSTDPASPDYDPGNLGRYLRTQRMIGPDAPGITRLEDDALFAHLRDLPTDAPVAM